MGNFSWTNFAIIAVMTAGIGTVVFFSVRASIRRRPQSEAGFGTVRATRALATIYAVFSIGYAATSVARVGFGEYVTVFLPVRSFWPRLPEGASVDGLTAEVTAGGFTEAQVDVTGLDASARSWLVAEQIIQGATGAIIAIVIALLCSSILRRDPFRATAPRAITLSAVTIAVGGLAWQACGAIGGSLAAGQILDFSGGQIDADTVKWDDYTDIIGVPIPGHQWTLDFWPIAAGLALFALATVFRHGTKLARETDGLV